MPLEALCLACTWPVSLRSTGVAIKCGLPGVWEPQLIRVYLAECESCQWWGMVHYRYLRLYSLGFEGFTNDQYARPASTGDLPT